MSNKASQELSGRILTQLSQSTRPLSIRALLKQLAMPKHANRQLKRLLKLLVAEGKVISEGRGRYASAASMPELEGIFEVKGKGPAWVVSADGLRLRIPDSSWNGALPGDSVVAIKSRTHHNGVAEGRIIGVVTRGDKPLIGVYHANDQVQRVLDAGGNAHNDLERRLLLMNRCARQISERLRARGQLVFDLAESRIELDGEGWPKTIRPIALGSANKMIEAFMVTANEAVACFLNRVDAACLYRIHPAPDSDRIEEFIHVAKSLGVSVPFASDPSAIQIVRFLESLQGNEKGPALEQLLLRSLMQARYSASCKEHFGLASSCYLHFTSPIRRYPDLVVHRQLSRVLSAFPHPVRFDARPHIQDWPLNPEQATVVADLCTRAERRSMACERKAQSLYHAAYMSRRIGQAYLGRVVMLTEFGLFVRLEPEAVEGLVHVANMIDDHYVLDPVDLVLAGQRTNKRYCIGDLLRVQIQDARLEQKQIDLTILSDEPKGD